MRSGGYEGTITVVDASRDLPGDRPPLSKGVLTGEILPEETGQPLATKLDDLNLDFRLDSRLTSLDAAARSVTFAGRDGEPMTLRGDAIIVATGARPKTFGLGEGLSGVHTLRNLPDALALREDLIASRQIVVIGAGFIGAEVAATARSMGKAVTLVEAEQSPMARVFPSEIGDWITQLHRGNGVEVRLGSGVSNVAGSTLVERVHLNDGSTLDADTVILGLGVTPMTEWLEGSGLDLTNGVMCDNTLRCAEGIFAAGDVANWFNELFDEQMRVEHWDHANEAGAAAGRAALASLGGEEPVPFSPVPWFWSDQYDAKIQMAGRCRSTDDVEIVQRDDENGRLLVAFRRHDRCTAVLGVNRPRHVIKARMAMAASLEWNSIREVLS